MKTIRTCGLIGLAAAVGLLSGCATAPAAADANARKNMAELGVTPIAPSCADLEWVPQMQVTWYKTWTK